MKTPLICLPTALLLLLASQAGAANKPAQLLPNDAPLTELISALDSEDFSTRMRAVSFLGNRKEDAKDAVPALVKALEDYHLRESALHSLRTIGPAASAAIPALYNALTAYPEQPATRWIAAHALANVGDAAIPTLEKGIASDNLYQLVWCTAALAKMKGQESPHFKTLADLLGSPDQKTSLVATEALTMIGTPSKVVLKEIIAAMDNPVAAKADLAVLLAQFGKDAKPAVPHLVKYLDDPRAMTRQRAAYALSEIGGADAAPAIDGLIHMLLAEQPFVREAAAVALGSIGESARISIPNLIERLADENEHVRAACVTALGRVDANDAKVLKALVDSMEDESGRVRSAAAPLLAKHAPITKEMIMLFIQASEDNWRAVSYACETFFGRLGPDQRDLIPAKFKDNLPRARR